jgi:hypothetical protein
VGEPPRLDEKVTSGLTRYWRLSQQADAEHDDTTCEHYGADIRERNEPIGFRRIGPQDGEKECGRNEK